MIFKRLEELLADLLEEQRITNKLLAANSGLSKEELDSLKLRRVDFSDATVNIPPLEGELLEEEDEIISNKISARLKDSRGKTNHFFEEDEISDIREEINET